MLLFPSLKNQLFNSRYYNMEDALKLDRLYELDKLDI